MSLSTALYRRSSPCIAATAALALVIFGCLLAAQDQPAHQANPLVNSDVVKLLKARLSQEVVIAKIKASVCDFDTSPEALTALKVANIPDAVLVAMVQAPHAPPVSSGQLSNNIGSLTMPKPKSKQSTSGISSAVSANQDLPSAKQMLVVRCGPNDVTRTLYGDSATTINSGSVACGEEVEVIENEPGGQTSRVRTSGGQVGYLYSGPVNQSYRNAETPTPTPGNGVSTAVAGKPDKDAIRAEKLCKKNRSWVYADCLSIVRHQVIVGMTYEVVIATWGQPSDTNTTQLSGGHSHVQLVYNNPNGGLAGAINSIGCAMPNQPGCTQYKNTYVYLEDGIVTSIQN